MKTNEHIEHGRKDIAMQIQEKRSRHQQGLQQLRSFLSDFYQELESLLKACEIPTEKQTRFEGLDAMQFVFDWQQHQYNIFPFPTIAKIPEKQQHDSLKEVAGRILIVSQPVFLQEEPQVIFDIYIDIFSHIVLYYRAKRIDKHASSNAAEIAVYVLQVCIKEHSSHRESSEIRFHSICGEQP